MKGKIFYKNLILVVLIFILSINSFVFADDVNTESTTENSIDNKDGVYYLGEKGEEEEVPLKVTPGHLYLPEVSGVNMNPQLAYNWGLNQYKNDDMNGFMGFYKNFEGTHTCDNRNVREEVVQEEFVKAANEYFKNSEELVKARAEELNKILDTSKYKKRLEELEKEKIEVINKLNAIDDVYARTGKDDNIENLVRST